MKVRNKTLKLTKLYFIQLVKQIWAYKILQFNYIYPVILEDQVLQTILFIDLYMIL